MSSSIPFVLLDEDMATADGKKIMPLLEEQEHDGDMEEPMGWGRGWWIVTGVGSLLVLGGLVWLLLLLTGGNSSSRNNLKILWMSDIHMDQWYNGSLAASCHCNPASVRPSLAISDAACAQEAQASGYLNGYSKPGCCSSRRLVESMMDDAVSTIPSPDLVLITGDYTRHSTSLLPDSLKNQTVMEAVSNVTVMVVDRFGGSSAVLLLPSELHTAGLVLGNNDFLPDYGLPDNQWMVQLHDVTRHTTAWTPEQVALFKSGGFSVFVLNISNSASRVAIINLNTVILSPHSNISSQTDPYSQFEWLNGTLWTLSSMRIGAYICGHVPPIVDSYSQTAMWADQHIDQYLEILGRYSETVRAQLFGHVHKDEWRVWRGSWPGQFAPLLLSGAVEAHFSNNPSYKILEISSEDFSVQDYTVRYADLKAANGELEAELEWAEYYSFKKLYNVNGLTNKVLSQLLDAMWTSGNAIPGTWSTYWGHRLGNYVDLGQMDTSSWYQKPFMHPDSSYSVSQSTNMEICILESFTQQNLTDCRAQHQT